MSPNESALARASYIRAVLAWHDLTQSDLARLLGITQPAASRKLKGKRRFEVDELVVIADTFGIDPAKLVCPPALADYLGTLAEESEGALLRRSKYKAPQVRAGLRAAA